MSGPQGQSYIALQIPRSYKYSTSCLAKEPQKIGSYSLGQKLRQYLLKALALVDCFDENISQVVDA